MYILILTIIACWFLCFMFNIVIWGESNFGKNSRCYLDDTFSVWALILAPLILPTLILILLYKRGGKILKDFFQKTCELVKFIWDN